MSENSNGFIFGYGKKIRVAVGAKEVMDGTLELDVQEFHITPVGIKLVPEIQNKLDKFLGMIGGDSKSITEPRPSNNIVMSWPPEAIDLASEIIAISLTKLHPKITKQWVADHFTLGALAASISIVMDINDFFSQMGEMNRKISEQTVTAENQIYKPNAKVIS